MQISRFINPFNDCKRICSQNMWVRWQHSCFNAGPIMIDNLLRTSPEMVTWARNYHIKAVVLVFMYYLMQIFYKYWNNSLCPIVLQTLHAELAPILQVIFQKSLDSGKLPHIWKEANVSPIFKKRRQVRPCKLSPDITYFVQTARHIVASNLTKHLANSNIFELQHRFREKRSCETQLV